MQRWRTFTAFSRCVAQLHTFCFVSQAARLCFVCVSGLRGGDGFGQVGILQPYSKNVIGNATMSQPLQLTLGNVTVIRVEVASEAYPSQILTGNKGYVSPYACNGKCNQDSCQDANCEYADNDRTFRTFRTFNLINTLRRVQSSDTSLRSIHMAADTGWSMGVPMSSFNGTVWFPTFAWTYNISYAVEELTLTVVSPNTTFPVSYVDHNPRQRIQVRQRMKLALV
jgi:hypothetical protein